MDKKRMMSWTKMFFLYGIRSKISFIMCALIAILALYYAIKFWYWGLEWYIVCYFLLLSSLPIYKMFFSRFVTCSKNYKMLSKTYGVAEWIRTIDFLDNEIILKDHTSKLPLQYSNICKIKEKADMALIHFNNKMIVIVYKESFVDGSWDECKALIESKKL